MSEAQYFYEFMWVCGDCCHRQEFKALKIKGGALYGMVCKQCKAVYNMSIGVKYKRCHKMN